MVRDAHIGKAHRACEFVQEATYRTQSLSVRHQVEVGVHTPRYARRMPLVTIANLRVEIAGIKTEQFTATNFERVLHFIANEDVHVSVHNDGWFAIFPCDGCQPRQGEAAHDSCDSWETG